MAQEGPPTVDSPAQPSPEHYIYSPAPAAQAKGSLAYAVLSKMRWMVLGCISTISGAALCAGRLSARTTSGWPGAARPRFHGQAGRDIHNYDC